MWLEGGGEKRKSSLPSRIRDFNLRKKLGRLSQVKSRLCWITWATYRRDDVTSLVNVLSVPHADEHLVLSDGHDGI